VTQPPIHLERTPLAQRQFDAITSEIPAINGAAMDPFHDDTPIEAQCDLENPESCESCQ